MGGSAVYDTIIVPLDGSDSAARALPPAATLANEYDSVVTITSVVSPSFVTSMTDTVRQQAAAAGIAYPVINLVVSARSPVPRLIEALDQAPAGILCMATTGRSHLGQVLGSVAEEILRVRSGPIMLVGPRCEPNSFKPRGRMIVPVDGSETSAEILAVAATWANAYHMEPEVVAVVDPNIEAKMGGGHIHVGTEANLPSRVAAELAADIGSRVDWEVLHNDSVSHAIVGRAADVGASIIAMSTHGRTGLPRVVLGSVTMAVVHGAECPVLVHRPLSF